MNQPQRSTLLDKCECGQSKYANRQRCYKCHAKWRYNNDENYRKSKNSRHRNEQAIVPCPRCKGDMMSKSRLCDTCTKRDVRNEGCMDGAVLSHPDVAMIYSYRNPDDPITTKTAKNTVHMALRKIRRALEQEGEDEELMEAVKNLRDYL